MRSQILICILLVCSFVFSANSQPLPESKDYIQQKAAGLLHVPPTPSLKYSGLYPNPYIFSGTNVIGNNQNCAGIVDFIATDSLTGCDDCYTGPIALGFDYEFYGTVYDEVYINSNGNITFGSFYTAFTSIPFPMANGVPMIAPFFADADLNGNGGISNQIKWAVVPNFETSGYPALVVLFEEVGYYNGQTTLNNTFQIIITPDSSDALPGGSNTAFLYGNMQWTTGDASGGSNGFGGISATVGLNLGNGVNFVQIGQFNSPGDGYTSASATNSGIDYLDDQCYFFSTQDCPITADAGLDLTIDCNTLDSVGIGSSPTGFGGVPPYTFVWTPFNGLSDPFVALPTALPYNTTTYTLTTMDSEGCVGVDNIKIEVPPSCVFNPYFINSGGVYTDTFLTVEELDTLSFLFDCDDPKANPIYLTATNLPSGAQMTQLTNGAPAQGSFLWVPDLGTEGVHTFNLLGTNSGGKYTKITVTVQVNKFVPAAIPTMSEWGLIFLSLLLLSTGLIYTSMAPSAVTLSGNGSRIGGMSIPFFKAEFQKAGLFSLLFGFTLLTLSLFLTGGVTKVDWVGGLICFPVFAYFLHLVFAIFGKGNSL